MILQAVKRNLMSVSDSPSMEMGSPMIEAARNNEESSWNKENLVPPGFNYPTPKSSAQGYSGLRLLSSNDLNKDESSPRITNSVNKSNLQKSTEKSKIRG